MNNDYYNKNYPINYLQRDTGVNNINYTNNTMKVPDAYVENSLFINIGMEATFHMSFPDSEKERDVVFKGVIKEATRDHIIIYDQRSNEWHLLPLLYLNYASSNETPNLILES